MTVYKIVAILLLVAANAFFVAAEFALVAVRRTRIEELVASGSRRALSAQKAISELNLMLSGCQLGITFASLGLGAIGEPVLARMLQGLFDVLASPFDLIALHTTAVVVAFVIITGLHVILGELVPKNLSIATPEATALWLATPMRAFTLAFRPLIWLFNESANGILHLMRIQQRPEMVSIHSPDELAIIVEESRRGGAIRKHQSEILTRTLEFTERRVVDSMVPRTAVQALQADSTLAEVLELVESTGYSRFPVWRDRPDEFVGVVYLKDVLRETRGDMKKPIQGAVREPILVPESVSLEAVLNQMQKERSKFAVVLDEFGSTAGIITMEDILEELVGEIRDEYDSDEEARKIEGGMRIPGTMRPDEVEEATGCCLPEGEYETVAGFILERLGRIARRGDEVSIDGWTIKVANVRRRRILSVDVLPPAPPVAESSI